MTEFFVGVYNVHQIASQTH